MTTRFKCYKIGHILSYGKWEDIWLVHSEFEEINIIMNYILRGIGDLKISIIIGLFIWIIFELLIYVILKRKRMIWKYVVELVFSIYCVWLIELVGLFSLDFSLNGIKNFSIVPFVGSSFIPVFLNFALFIPYGLLLPLVFSNCKWNWKKILLVGAMTSICIEVLQMFGGRYAEIDDFIINTLGAFVGYYIYSFIQGFRKNRKKESCSFGILVVALLVCFLGIYFVGDNSEQLPDGLSAVEDNTSEVRIYYGGESRTVSIHSDIYNYFSSQLSNCGGHCLMIDDSLDDEVKNESDSFIEILFFEPQTITFGNAENFSITNADRVLYNANKNILYWGNCDYEYSVDYTIFDAQLEEHRTEVLTQYQGLEKRIIKCFE